VPAPTFSWSMIFVRKPLHTFRVMLELS